MESRSTTQPTAPEKAYGHLPEPIQGFLPSRRVGNCTEQTLGTYRENLHRILGAPADAGIDFIIAQGVEAGPLVAAGGGSVAPIPLVAAGGIADGRGLATALTLGAEGMLLRSDAFQAHEVYKQKILAAHATAISTRNLLFIR